MVLRSWRFAMLVVCWTWFVAWSSGAASADDAPYGIEKRIPWTTSRIVGSPEPPPPYRIERVFPRLEFKNPVELVTAPGCDRWFMVEVDGKIHSFKNDPDGTATDVAFDLNEKYANDKARVYSLTFHPQFERNRYCYICYITEPDIEDGTHVSRFKVDSLDPPHIDMASEQVVITWRSGGHNGCCLKFGADGCLYISTGDGGPAFPPDPLNSGQDVSNLRSSVLRIDVDHPTDERHYSIPQDNPFVNLAGARGEVWAYGFRNPWRMSFDPRTGALWVGDVGWELWEMIYRVVPGGNYGWSLFEGSQPVHRERTRGPTPILPPTIEHSHIESRSITGGAVYHGSRLKQLDGCYVYGDYVTGKIWGARFNDKSVTEVKELVDTSLQVICFGVDPSGELLVVDYLGGIYRLVSNETAVANRDFPTKLSDTGLFASVHDHQLAAGLIPYSINAEPWADGAVAQRFVALPGESQLGIHDATNVQVGYIKGDWKFPSDAVLGKTISIETSPGQVSSRQRLETQILHYDRDTWRAYTYIWNDQQTDAELAPSRGADRTIAILDTTFPGGVRTQNWHFPGRSECILCHTTRGGSIYGFNPAQLNRPHDYGGVTDNQLRTLAHIGLFEQPIADPAAKLPSPWDESLDINTRARAYLHINCAHCHRRGGGGSSAMELPYEFALDRTNMIHARPTQGTFDIPSAEVVAPGDPFRSVLYYRMAKTGRGRMPYFGSSEVDERGVKLIHDWIKQLPANDVPDVAKKIRDRTDDALTSLRAATSDPQRSDIVNDLLTSTTGAMALLREIDTGTLDAATRRQAIELASAHQDMRIRDLYERFLPEEKRTKRLGSIVDAEQLLALSGDAARGRKLFLDTSGVQCKNCHQVGDQGTKLGPELTQIGKKYDRVQLLETILQPSKAIDPSFLTYLVETADGRVHTGLLVSRSAEQVILKNAQNKDVTIPASEIELIAPQQSSLMPDLLLQDMTAEQVADLLEFLSTLK